MRGFVAAEEGLSVGAFKRTDQLLLGVGGILGGGERCRRAARRSARGCKERRSARVVIRPLKACEITASEAETHAHTHTHKYCFWSCKSNLSPLQPLLIINKILHLKNKEKKGHKKWPNHSLYYKLIYVSINSRPDLQSQTPHPRDTPHLLSLSGWREHVSLRWYLVSPVGAVRK